MSDHRIMAGSPVPRTERIPRRDWDRAPWNRWSFQHIREVLPTVEVWRGSGPVWQLPEAPRDLDLLEFDTRAGNKSTITDWLKEDFTDGFIVLHRGAIVYERYLNNMTARTLHLSQSVAKSITAAVFGILVQRGALDPEKGVVDYLPELKRTAWKTAKLRHVLDMQTGVKYNEDYQALDSDMAATDIASGWKAPLGRNKGPACIWDQILSLKTQQRPHGEIFDYQSIQTDVLAHCMERVTGLPLAELISNELWSKLGVDESANFTVDAGGYALACGGFSASLRDYARFGQMILNGGIANGRSIVPLEWIEDCQKGDHGKFGDSKADVLPHGAYRNQFWMEDHRKRTLMARGVFGQLIYMNPDAELVAVKLSSWPEFLSDERGRNVLCAIHAIADYLND